MVAADVRNEQRRAERKAVRRDDRDDVQRDDDGVGAHPSQDAPSLPWRIPLTFLLEREDERAAIAAVLDGRGRLRAGQRAGGDRQDRAAGRGRATQRVLRARGSELERSFAFGGVQQLFARVQVPYSGAAAHAAGAFSAGGEPDHAVLHGLYWLTAGLGPLAIVVDDAHWLDQPSLRWLAYMVNRVADLPLALLLAARSDEQDELLSRIALHPSTTVLSAEAAVGGRGRRARRPGARRRDPRGHRRRPVLRARDGRDRRPDAAPGGRVDRAAAGGAAAGLPAARPRDRRRRQRRDDRRPPRGPRRPRRRDRRRGAGEGRPARRRRLRPPARPAGRLRRDPGGRARRAARRRRRGW